MVLHDDSYLTSCRGVPLGEFGTDITSDVHALTVCTRNVNSSIVSSVNGMYVDADDACFREQIR